MSSLNPVMNSMTEAGAIMPQQAEEARKSENRTSPNFGQQRFTGDTLFFAVCD